jgi:hypothetical protein
MSRAQVQDVLGKPENTGGTSRKRRVPPIWKYGDIELHFDDSGVLVLIHLDHFTVPAGGNALELEPWSICGGMEQAELERAFAAEGIGYTRQSVPGSEAPCLVTDSGVSLIFNEDEASGWPRGLCAMSASVHRTVTVG